MGFSFHPNTFNQRNGDHSYGITLRKLPGFSAALVSDVFVL